MNILKVCKVVGNVVSTKKDENIVGYKLMIVQPIDMYTLKSEGSALVAVDVVGAGEGEIVLVVAGSSARLTEMTKNKPADATICGIIDYIKIENQQTYTK